MNQYTIKSFLVLIALTAIPVSYAGQLQKNTQEETPSTSVPFNKDKNQKPSMFLGFYKGTGETAQLSIFYNVSASRGMKGLQIAGFTNESDCAKLDESDNKKILELKSRSWAEACPDSSGLQLAGWSNESHRFRGVQMGGLTNTSSGIMGVQLAGLFNTASLEKYESWGTPVADDNKAPIRYGAGIQLAGLMNHADAFSGLQVGGLTNKATSISGIQLAGFSNRSYLDSKILEKAGRGLQIAGLFNCAGVFSGVQLGGICNKAKNFKGIQLAGLGNNCGTNPPARNPEGQGNFKGLQIAGLYNQTGTMVGVQMAGLVNMATSVQGGQIGLVNTALFVNGVQIGLVNVCKRLGGVQIGLINGVLDEPTGPRWMVLVNARF